MSFQLDPSDNQPQGFSSGEAESGQSKSPSPLRNLVSVRLILGSVFFVGGILLYILYPEAESSNNFWDLEANLLPLGRLALVIIGAILVFSHVLSGRKKQMQSF